jgi:septal ring factor EnvC (AmiA/AmiB activator)
MKNHTRDTWPQSVRLPFTKQLVPTETLVLIVPSLIIIAIMGATTLDTAGQGAVIGLLITTIFGFFSTLATMFYQGWSSARQRRWDREDREREADKIRQQLEASRIELTRQTAEHANLVAKRMARTEEKIDLNTKLTKAASDHAAEASRVGDDLNRKLETNQEQLKQLQTQLSESLPPPPDQHNDHSSSR